MNLRAKEVCLSSKYVLDREDGFNATCDQCSQCEQDIRITPKSNFRSSKPLGEAEESKHVLVLMSAVRVATESLPSIISVFTE